MPTTVSLCTVRTYQYGPLPSQVGDLHLPACARPPVVCLLHGGFWRMPHGREQLTAVAGDLAARGYAVWNIGYRRLGEAGGGWPGTLNDVAAAVDHLATLVANGLELDQDRVIVVGHSAGGQLALAVAAQGQVRTIGAPTRVRPVAAASLAGVVDLAASSALGVGRGAVEEFLGGSPERYPERYAAASPLQLLPLRVSQLLLHGGKDAALPIDLTRRYAKAAQAAGDPVQYVELPEAGHMDYLDPHSEAHAALCAWLVQASTTQCTARTSQADADDWMRSS